MAAPLLYGICIDLNRKIKMFAFPMNRFPIFLCKAQEMQRRHEIFKVEHLSEGTEEIIRLHIKRSDKDIQVTMS